MNNLTSKKFPELKSSNLTHGCHHQPATADSISFTIGNENETDYRIQVKIKERPKITSQFENIICEINIFHLLFAGTVLKALKISEE